MKMKTSTKNRTIEEYSIIDDIFVVNKKGDTLFELLKMPEDYIIKIPEGIKYISSEFGKNSNKIIGSYSDLELDDEYHNLTVIFPDSLLTIGINAFLECNIVNVVFNKNLYSIGAYAFLANPIKKIEFPEGSKLKFIDHCAFKDCSELVTVDLSNTRLRNIGQEAFFNCTKLENVIFPKEHNTFLNIDSYAFLNCVSLHHIVFTYLKSLGASCFKYCNLERIIFKETCPILYIPDDTFSMNYNIELIILPNNITNISLKMIEGSRVYDDSNNLVIITTCNSPIRIDNNEKLLNEDSSTNKYLRNINFVMGDVNIFRKNKTYSKNIPFVYSQSYIEYIADYSFLPKNTRFYMSKSNNYCYDENNKFDLRLFLEEPIDDIIKLNKFIPLEDDTIKNNKEVEISKRTIFKYLISLD